MKESKRNMSIFFQFALQRELFTDMSEATRRSRDDFRMAARKPPEGGRSIMSFFSKFLTGSEKKGDRLSDLTGMSDKCGQLFIFGTQLFFGDQDVQLCNKASRSNYFISLQQYTVKQW